MISVLIPVFNTNICKLVCTLSKQLQTIGLAGEIIVIDDFSDDMYKKENRTVAAQPFVLYKELNQNVGRIEIRKLLSKEANYEWLLFVDGDSEILHSDFLVHYINAERQSSGLVTGGRVYEKESPKDCKKMLHWRYGSIREDVVGKKKGLMTNNLLIKKNIFEQLSFPNQLNKYGHEDTWMLIQLSELGIPIQYINNPVKHLGLETADVFLQKSKSALQNLLWIKDSSDQKTARRHIRILDVYYRQKQFGLSKVIFFIYQLLEKYIIKHLTSCRPSLLVFDFYRLSNFIKLADTH